ncbi:MAG: hypothetical protein EPGJADBJ_00171 [Saprospiraceae bacterium]|nr:hypothetical protein [Saprospiraceae bacterium]
MKAFRILLVFNLLLAFAPLPAQQNSGDCTDIVYLRNGSEFRGKIIEYAPGGNLVLVTWSGVNMTVPADNVKRIVQRCKEDKRQKGIYDFRERGLYNATRLGVLAGETYYRDNTSGYSLCHSLGWMFRRWMGAGIGGGVEIFDPGGYEAATYPIFAEVRGYLLAKNIAPFYTVGGGWAFTGKNGDEQQGFTEDWKGGWMTKIQFGYRLGNHFTLHGGLSLQKKIRNWQSVWGNDRGQDRILHKRLEVGIGVIL